MGWGITGSGVNDAGDIVGCLCLVPRQTKVVGGKPCKL